MAHESWRKTDREAAHQSTVVALQPYHGRRDSQTPEVDEGTLCGLGPFHPPWIQRLASKKTYVLLYGLIGLMVQVVGTYFIGTISTLEKRFKISSKQSGMIPAALDMVGFFSLLVFGYLGSRGHKPRYIACGAIGIGLSCFIRLLPHMLYGPGQDALGLTLEYGADLNKLSNITSGPTDSVSVCGNIADNNEDCSEGSAATSNAPFIIFFLAHAFMGLGDSAYYSLGMAYLDNNTHKDKAAILLAVSQCLRLLGPTVGYFVSSYTLSYYVDPSLHPIIDNDDPRWIGAWWLGWAPIGIVLFIMAGLMMLFPLQLPRAAMRKAQEGVQTMHCQKSFNDFRLMFCRLLRNKVLLLNTFSGVCFMLGYVGYGVFMPKYMETQYRKSAADANFITGAVGLTFTAVGLMASALVIYKFKPCPRTLAGYNVVVEIIDVIGHIWWVFLSCPLDNLHGSWTEDNNWNLTDSCNSSCDCGPAVKYAPVCSLDGNVTFYSPCHGGCTSWDLVNGTKMFGNCSCLSGGMAMDGPCPIDCATNFTIFIITQCIMHFLQSSGKAGNILIQFRCVSDEDKALSIALSEVLLSGLAFVPGPIVYGMLLVLAVSSHVDGEGQGGKVFYVGLTTSPLSIRMAGHRQHCNENQKVLVAIHTKSHNYSACLVWDQSCGLSGNCWLYDGQTLRYLLNFTAAGWLLIGTVLDIGVWYYAKDLKIYEKHGPHEGGKKKSGTLANIFGLME